MQIEHWQLFLLFVGCASGANMVPPLAAKLLPKWKQPIDFGTTFRGEQLFGDHKTLRGFVFGSATAGLIFLIFRNSIPEANAYAPYFGVIIGLVALTGDALKSFFKRQSKIPAGSTWIPWDQIDWIIATSILFCFTTPFSLALYLIFFSAGFVGHIIANIFSYLLKINARWI